MPTSSINQVPIIFHIARTTAPTSILDAGIGSGRYGYLLRDDLDSLHLKGEWTKRIDGIEVFPGYITPVQRYIYDNIMIGNLPDILSTIQPQCYDLVLMLDVLEHFDKRTGAQVLRHLLRVGKTIIVSTPKEWIEQGAVYDNDAEIHQSLWTVRDLTVEGYAPPLMAPNTDNWIAVYTQSSEVRAAVGRFLFRQFIKRWLPDALHTIGRRISPGHS